MFDERRVAGLVGEVYDCVAEPSSWSKALTSLSDLFGAVVTTVAISDNKSGLARLRVAGGKPEVFTPLLNDCPAANLPIFKLTRKMELDTALGASAFLSVLGPKTALALAASPLTWKWVIPNHIRDHMCTAILRNSSSTGILSVITSSSRGRLTKDELEQLNFLSPHIRRAASIGDLFNLELRNEAVFKSVVDHFVHSVLVVDGNMKILYANPAAEEALRGRAAISMQRGKLVFANGYTTDAVETAVKTGARDEVAISNLGIGVPVTKSATPAIAHVLPLSQRKTRGSKLDSKGVAAIFIAFAGSGPTPPVEAIASLFGLTSAEKKVTRLMSEGYSRADIADSFGLSENTIRTHMSAVFSKTGKNSQREVAQLVRELTPGVASAESASRTQSDVPTALEA